MKTDTINLRQQIQQLQDDNRRLRRINDLQARTIDQADRALQLRHIVQRWEQLRESPAAAAGAADLHSVTVELTAAVMMLQAPEPSQGQAVA